MIYIYIYNNRIHICDYRKLLQDAENCYFIISLKNFAETASIIKILQYSGIDEFGIIYEGYTKDFNGKIPLQKAFFESINEVFQPIGFLNNWNELENIRRASLEGAGYWDIPYMCIHKLYKKKPGATYLEIGAGIGILSLSLKKLLDIDVTWVTIPDEESLWGEWRRKSSQEILKKYDIKTIPGFIETDSFTGFYDIIVLAQVMEHLIFNPVNTFKKLARLVKDDGYIFVSVPYEIIHHNVESYRDMPYPEQLSVEERQRRNAINNYGHFHEYSYQEAIDVFRESGLECIGYKWTLPIHHFMLRKSTPGQKPEEGTIFA